MRRITGNLCLFLALCLISVMSMTGCGKKETDPSANEVMKLNVTPTPTPVPSMDDIPAEAITQKGTVTMINEYVNQKLNKAAQSEETGEDASTEEKTEETSEQTTEQITE